MSVRPIVLALVLLAAGQATAANFCVDTAAELTSAFAAASANNGHDEIRVRTGVYVAPSAGFFYLAASSDSNNHLNLSGGWSDANCTVRDTTPGATSIDGEASKPLLDLSNPHVANASHTIVVEYLTFAYGWDPNGQASLNVQQTGAPAGQRVEHCVFRGNQSQGGAAGPVIGSNGIVIFRNNLIAGNETSSGPPAGLFHTEGNAQLYVQNNTVTNNTMVGVSQISGWKFDLYDNTVVDVSNNIVWGNLGGQTIGAGQPDLNLVLHGEHLTFTMKHNVIGFVPNLLLPAGHVQTLSVDPEFVGNGDYRLSDASTLIDAGTSGVFAPGGLGSNDVAGRARVSGAAVDIGAFEHLDVQLFRDDFE